MTYQDRVQRIVEWAFGSLDDDTNYDIFEDERDVVTNEEARAIRDRVLKALGCEVPRDWVLAKNLARTLPEEIAARVAA